jgi:hypothetical protein
VVYLIFLSKTTPKGIEVDLSPNIPAQSVHLLYKGTTESNFFLEFVPGDSSLVRSALQPERSTWRSPRTQSPAGWRLLAPLCMYIHVYVCYMYVYMYANVCKRVCCLLALDSVISTTQYIHTPAPSPPFSIFPSLLLPPKPRDCVLDVYVWYVWYTCLYTDTHVCVCACIRIYVGMYVCTNQSTHKYVCMHACMHPFIYVCVCV